MARPEEPAQAGKGYPLRTRPQTFHEWLMPCTQFEALKRRQQAWRDRGVDSDEETVQDETKDEDKDEDDPQEEPAPLEARIRTTTVDMFKHVLLFSQGVAEAPLQQPDGDDSGCTLRPHQRHHQGALPCHQEARGGWIWTPNLQAFHDPPQAVCVLGKAHVADFKRCR